MSRTRTVEFGPLRIAYDHRVLAPRPWTFAQSAWAAELLRDAPAGPILELCSGAGQIGLAAGLLSGRDVVLVDADPAAAELAVRNAADAGLGGRVEMRQGRVDEVLEPDERFVLVLADPPYIPSADTGTFPEDPLSAIDGGVDGLDLARLCLRAAAAHLDEGHEVLLQLRDPAQVEQLTAELRGGRDVPLEHVDSRVVDDRGALLRLRRT